MKSLPIIVLKFGSSVLKTSDDAPRVAHEVYRWVRKGYRVVAVVSALDGETDQLLAQAHRWDEIPHQSATALLASTGELRSAALLTLALDRAGIEAQVLDVAAIGLRTRGIHALDARPVQYNVAKLRRLLTRFSVIVLPGFTGRDSLGRTTLLGRGGSDCSALFLARGLGARCRLVKDVDGLYEWDPHQLGTAPRKFRQLGWDDALKLNGGIVQHKAIEFARQSKQSFEVGALFQQAATEIGDRAKAFCEDRARPIALRVVLLGLGTVGRGVFDAVQSLPEYFEIVAVAVRDKSRARGIPDGLLVDDLREAAQLPCDVVVELIGESDSARRAMNLALRCGHHVLTANKRVIAESGLALVSLADSQGVSIRWSAAVGGAVPILEQLEKLPLHEEHVAIEAVLNGTTNYVLDRWQSGLSLDEAIAEAQDAGFAEADASRDLSGQDAVDKLVLIHRQLTGKWLAPLQVHCEPLDERRFNRPRKTPRPCFRQVAAWTKFGDQFQLSVEIRQLDKRHPLSRLKRQENGAIIRTSSGLQSFVRGKGAGRWPTTEAVMADLFDLAAQPLASTPFQICTREPLLVEQVST